MSNKYYTPSIEEFRAGFRFELIESSPIETMINNSNPDDLKPFQYIENDRTYYKCTYLKHEINRCSLDQELVGKDGVENNLYLFRTKYLDQQDIEELGWTTLKNNIYYTIQEDVHKSYFMYRANLRGNNWSISYVDSSDEDEETVTLFDGEIRNYNELKFIMERVGIDIKIIDNGR